MGQVRVRSAVATTLDERPTLAVALVGVHAARGEGSDLFGQPGRVVGNRDPLGGSPRYRTCWESSVWAHSNERIEP